jgi:hypothetical protein
MLTTPTVFILGAGSSVPYEFPTGFRLSDLVVRGAQPGQSLFNDLHDKAGRSEADIRSFREQFLGSGKNSVDAFLEYRDDLIEIGKLATAQVLIGRENHERLFQFDGSWLRTLYNRMATDFTEFKKNKVAFITFNYDRTVEHFFHSALTNSYSKIPRSEIELAIAAHVPIIHLHGHLGSLPWQGKAPDDSRPFEPHVTAESLKIAAKSIKVIHEDIVDRDAEFLAAKKLIDGAEKIVLLGFGYNSRNIERLGIQDLPPDKAISTCYQMPGSAEQAAIKATNGKIRFISGDCTRFVTEELRWD